MFFTHIMQKRDMHTLTSPFDSYFYVICYNANEKCGVLHVYKYLGTNLTLYYLDTINLIFLSFLEHNSYVIYRVIHKSLQDLRPLWYSIRDGQSKGEHVNRGRDTPSFCPTLQVLDMSNLGDAADFNPVIKFLPLTCVCGRNLITGLTSAASPRLDISSTSKVEQKLGVSLLLLTCSP